MKKSVKRLLFSLVFVIFTVLLSGCEKKELDEKIFGTWEYSEDGYSTEFIFKEDGTGSETIKILDSEESKDSISSFTYKTKSGIIYITFENDSVEFEYKYRFNDKDLVLKDSFNEEITYKKR